MGTEQGKLAMFLSTGINKFYLIVHYVEENTIVNGSIERFFCTSKSVYHNNYKKNKHVSSTVTQYFHIYMWPKLTELAT